MLTPDQQSLLDDAYWHSTRTIADVRRQFGLTVSQLNKTVTPLPIGSMCWWCRAQLHFRNRTERNDSRKPWSRLRCSCGAQQPPIVQRDGLVDSDAAIIAPLFDRPDHYVYGRGAEPVGRASELVCQGVEALARCGLRWAGEFRVVEADDAPDDVVRRLEQNHTRVVVIPSLTDAMTNEGDSLALFLRLVERGWRVITSADSHARAHTYSGWCDDLVDPWQALPRQGLRLV